jgi:four helix bundle protein
MMRESRVQNPESRPSVRRSDHNFENLEVWKRASRLAVEVCVAWEESTNFPLKDQIRRSAISIPSNIAEGAERTTDRDFSRFLDIAKGSCGELRTQLQLHKGICRELSRDPFQGTDAMISESKEISKMLGGLIKHLNVPAR